MCRSPDVTVRETFAIHRPRRACTTMAEALRNLITDVAASRSATPTTPSSLRASRDHIRRTTIAAVDVRGGRGTIETDLLGHNGRWNASWRHAFRRLGVRADAAAGVRLGCASKAAVSRSCPATHHPHRCRCDPVRLLNGGDKKGALFAHAILLCGGGRERRDVQVGTTGAGFGPRRDLSGGSARLPRARGGHTVGALSPSMPAAAQSSEADRILAAPFERMPNSAARTACENFI